MSMWTGSIRERPCTLKLCVCVCVCVCVCGACVWWCVCVCVCGVVCVCVCVNPIVSFLKHLTHFSRNLLRILYHWRTLRIILLNVLQSEPGKTSSVQTSEATATLATQCRFLDMMVNDGETCKFFSLKKYFCRMYNNKCGAMRGRGGGELRAYVVCLDRVNRSLNTH